ncbi:MAG: bifunctional glutamate N-acetyltransferase/amino-acid acetyltransferase ArgJ, partial [Actinobacteria bacterium]|nr:bifunctional glutamate N-acetyltransferase/amino-acid acetyltransferase ArgJ [Actinomycetota bacterium]
KVIINSGTANACTGIEGIENAKKAIGIASKYLKVNPDNILISSTGRIGKHLPLDKIEKGLEICSRNLSSEGGHHAARAILTIDKHPKEFAVKINLKNKDILIGGIAKGSVMVEPDMATTLVFLATNAKISRSVLDILLFECIDKTFNCVSTDGCQSTNDMVIIIANGESNVDIFEDDKTIYEQFKSCLLFVLESLAKMIVEDGEGATKVVEINVIGARDGGEARQVGKRVANSILFKTAMYGEDLNWGRIASAAGSTESNIDSSKVDIFLADIPVMKDGMAVNYDEEQAGRLLKERYINFTINLNTGSGSARILTNDISNEYIKINALYKKQR